MSLLPPHAAHAAFGHGTVLSRRQIPNPAV